MRNQLLLLLVIPMVLFYDKPLPERKFFSTVETHDFITYDSILNIGGQQIRFKISRPRNMFTPGHPDTASRPVLLHMGGKGETGTDYAKLSLFGPHYWLYRLPNGTIDSANGWDGRIETGSGTHYPIIISAMYSVVNGDVSGYQATTFVNHLLNTYRIKRNSVHALGLSMGAFTWVGMLNWSATETAVANNLEATGGEDGMKLLKSIVALQGQSNLWGSQTVGTNGSVYAGGTNNMAAAGHWAVKYGGKFLGLEGTNDDRQVWRVQQNMNDSMPGSAYFSMMASPWDTHCCWNGMYSPYRTTWRSTGGSLPSPLVQGGFPVRVNTMGTYRDGDNLFTWSFKQGDTSLVGGGVAVNNPPTASAGPDQGITLPISSVFLESSGTDDVGITARVWTKVSGPSSFTISTPTAASTTVFGLVEGTYVFRITNSDGEGLTASDDVTVTVAPAGNVAPTVNAGANQTITLPNSTVTLSATASDPDGTIVSYLWTKNSGGTATIVSSTSASTDINNLNVGVYDFVCTVTDNQGATTSDHVTVTVNPSPSIGETFYWNPSTTNILITNSTFGRALTYADSVRIPFRSGGYRSHSYTNLNSGIPGDYINVYWEPGAYITPSSSSLLANILTTTSGLKVTGVEMQNHKDGFWRLAGYSNYIWVDSLNNNGSQGIGNVYTGTYTPFDGNIANSFHHWTISNSSFDSLYTAQDGGKAITLGKMLTTGYWFDVDLFGNYFGNYSSDSVPSIYISADNSYNVKIHDNTFYKLGYEVNPFGHASVINTAGGKIHVYRNKFIGNFGNAIRGSSADVPAMGGDYVGRSTVYNNLSVNNRKYAFGEFRPVYSESQTLLSAYLRNRASPEFWNNTVVNSGVGTGNTPYSSGLLDSYATDTVHAKNNVVVGILDAAWGSTYSPKILWEAVGNITFKDTSNNRLYQFWSSAGLQDSVFYRPTLLSPLYNAGTAVPGYLNTDIYGVNRSSAGGVDIGAAEAFFINNRKIIPRRLSRATRFKKVD